MTLVGNIQKKAPHIGRTTKIVTANYTILFTDDMVICNSTTAIALTLPIAPFSEETMFTIININTGAVTIQRDPSLTLIDIETNKINGADTYLLSVQYRAVTLTSHLTHWYATSEFDTGTGLNNVVEDLTPQAGGDFEMNGNMMKWSKGSDIASANSIIIPTDGNYFDVTGTITIASIGSSSGVGVFLAFHFDDILILTNGATMKLPGGNNITTQANDEAIFIQDTLTSARLVSYLRYDGTALVTVLNNDIAPQLFARLETNQQSIEWEHLFSVDHRGAGLEITFTAGENLVIGDICYLKSDNKFWKADANIATTVQDAMMAVAKETIVADATGRFLKWGFIRDDSWSWTVGGALYVSATPGNPVQTAPATTGDIQRPVGNGYSATVMYVNVISTHYIIAP